MLEPKIKQNDIIVLKLVTGEEVIGRYQFETNQSITLSKTYSIAIQMTNQGQALGLAPVLVVSDPNQNIEIEKSAVMIRSTPPANHPVVHEYQKSTSGIMQVSAPGFQI